MVKAKVIKPKRCGRCGLLFSLKIHNPTSSFGGFKEDGPFYCPNCGNGLG